MKYEEFPRALGTPVLAAFYRFRGEGEVAGGQQVLMKTPDRFSYDFMKINKKIMEAKLESDYHTHEWIETEYPIHLPWSRSGQELMVAVLPTVEIPSELFEWDPHTFAAISDQAELGFINPTIQKCWEPVAFTASETERIKTMAENSGWLFEEYVETFLDLVRREAENERQDDGRFDQITHSFYAGSRRCGWCGSSSVVPEFYKSLFEDNVKCISCESIGKNSVDDRNALNLSNYE